MHYIDLFPPDRACTPKRLCEQPTIHPSSFVMDSWIGAA
jgi:hypothetical protein